MAKYQLAKEGLFNGTMNVTRAALDQMVETATDDVPVIVSHYQFGEYAAGWVRSGTLATELINNEYSLVGNVDFLPHVQTALESEELKHWSIMALPIEGEENKYRLIHLALLGANLPAISGLKKLDSNITAALDTEQISNGALKFEFAINTKPDGKKMDEIKELNEKVEALTLELSTTKETSETEKIELQKNLDTVTAKKAELETEIAGLKERVAEFENTKFNDLLLELETVGKGKLPAEDLKNLVNGYKERGIECKHEVDTQIMVLSKIAKIVPGSKPLVENGGMTEDEERELAEARKRAAKPKGM